jgi:GxxExxY protein
MARIEMDFWDLFPASVTSAQSAVSFPFIMLHEEITRDILGAAMAVLNELKPGLDEKLYENALVIELLARGHTVEQQREYPVHYCEKFIGKLVPDLIIDGKVIADPKVVTAFNESHVAQMLGYLNITGLEVALLINFKDSRLSWKRVANERRSGKSVDDPDIHLA